MEVNSKVLYLLLLTFRFKITQLEELTVPGGDISTIHVQSPDTVIATCADGTHYQIPF